MRVMFVKLEPHTDDGIYLSKLREQLPPTDQPAVEPIHISDSLGSGFYAIGVTRDETFRQLELILHSGRTLDNGRIRFHTENILGFHEAGKKACSSLSLLACSIAGGNVVARLRSRALSAGAAL